MPRNNTDPPATLISSSEMSPLLLALNMSLDGILITASHKQYIGENLNIHINAFPALSVDSMILKTNIATGTRPPSKKLWIIMNFSPVSSVGKINEKKYVYGTIAKGYKSKANHI